MDRGKKVLLDLATLAKILLVIILALAIIFVIFQDRVEFQSNVIELGSIDYKENLIRKSNLKKGSEYNLRIVDSNVDINTEGEYKVTVEYGSFLKFREKKKVYVKDNIPPKIIYNRNYFYIGEDYNFDNIIKVYDVSVGGKKKLSDFKYNIDTDIKDTNSPQNGVIKIEVEDVNGNKITEENEFKVISPVIDAYDYIKNKLEEDPKRSKNFYKDETKKRFILDESKTNDLVISYEDFVKGEINLTKISVSEDAASFWKNRFLNKDLQEYAAELRYKPYSVFGDEVVRVEATEENPKIEDDMEAGKNKIKELFKVIGDEKMQLPILGKSIKELKNIKIDMRVLENK